VWLFKGGEWRRLGSNIVSPPGQMGGWAFDPSSRLLARYGGIPESRESADSMGLWVWDGERWHENVGSGGPPGRRTMPEMCFLGATVQVLVYGGEPRAPSDTWTLTMER